MGLNAPADDLDATLAALADPARRRVIEALSDAPRRSGELAEQIGVSPATMSKHLRVLRTSGLVTQTTDTFDPRVRVYSRPSAPMANLRKWLADAEQTWSEQLGAVAQHLSDHPTQSAPADSVATNQATPQDSP